MKRLIGLMVGILFPVMVQAASVTMAWDYTANSHVPTDFTVYRQNNCTGVFAKVGTVPATQKTFVDSGVSFGVLYCWKVTAVDSVTGEESGFSNLLTFQVPKEVLAVPTNLRVP